jgi:acyl carrier protein
MQSLPAALREIALTRIVAGVVRSTLGMRDEEEIDPNMPFTDLGMDSLLALELRNGLSVALDRHFSPTLLFDHPTLRSLVTYVGGELVTKSTPANTLEVSSFKSPDAIKQESAFDLLQAIEQMSDDEVELLDFGS